MLRYGSYELLGYAATTSTKFPMSIYNLPVSGLSVKVGWGVTYGVQDRLFSFFMSPDEC